MYIVASFVGFLAGLVSWFVGNYLVAQFIYWGSNRQPHPMRENVLKAYELLLCSLVFIISATLLYVVARALWPDPA
ncbi:MAG: hypothetical protein HY231_25915 [Acidobacteria bacterium]|nr:hypothetical protein [Acidobacteriota bacterium]